MTTAVTRFYSRVALSFYDYSLVFLLCVRFGYARWSPGPPLDGAIVPRCPEVNQSGEFCGQLL